MKFLGKIFFYIVVNALAIWAAAYLVPDFILQKGWVNLLTAAAVLTLINIFIRPLLKLIFGPLVILTFGAFLFVINVITLFLLDNFSASININGLIPLFWATVIVSLINILCGYIFKP